MVSGNRVTLLHDGEQAFPAMLGSHRRGEARNPPRDVLVRLGRGRPPVRRCPGCEGGSRRASARDLRRGRKYSKRWPDVCPLARCRLRGRAVQPHRPVARALSHWRREQPRPSQAADRRSASGLHRRRESRRRVGSRERWWGRLARRHHPNRGARRRADVRHLRLRLAVASSSRRPWSTSVPPPVDTGDGRAAGFASWPTTTSASVARSGRPISAGSRAPSGRSASPTAISSRMGRSAACLGGPSTAAPRFA